MVRHSLDSINDFARQGYDVRLRCVNCGHVTDRSAVELMRQLHARGLGLAVDALERRAKCSHCSRRGARITPVAVPPLG